MPKSPPGDFWMAVDNNLGYNKANIYVERAFSYDVTLGDQPQALLTINYRHTGPAGEDPCYQGVKEEFQQATDYLSLADQCYWNFLRVPEANGSSVPA